VSGDETLTALTLSEIIAERRRVEELSRRAADVERRARLAITHSRSLIEASRKRRREAERARMQLHTLWSEVRRFRSA
jgi:hypothetical protein